MAGDEEVVLDWAKNAGDGTTATSWQYQYKTTGGYGAWTTVPGARDAARAYTVTGLKNGTAHTFRMRAVNAAGPGPASAEGSATPKIQLPDKPTGLSAAIGDEKIALSWDDPQNSRITGWRYSKDNGTTWTDVPNSGASTTTYTVTGLDNDTAYTFRVRAVTQSGETQPGETQPGEGPSSDPVTATPKAVPNPPANPAAAPGGSGEIVLTWDADSTATGWQYRYKTSGGYGGWVDIPCVSPCNPGTLNTYTVTGLRNNIQYTFQVRSRNDIGWGLPSELITRPVAGAPTAPALSAAAGGDGSVTLWWTYGGGIWVDSWQYSSDGGTNWSAIADSSRLTRSGKVTLANGKSYTFQVRGVNGKGVGAASGSRTAATLPLAPATFTATGGDRQVALAWSRDTDDDTVTGWRYRYKSTGGYTGWINVPNSNANTTTYTVTGLDNSVMYKFQLRAVNGTGGGAPTTEVTAYTIPAAPTGLTLTPGFEKVTLRWTNPTGGATLTDTEYRYKPKASDDSDYTDWTAIDSVVTTKEVAGLDRGVRYTFQVRAVNATGDGSPSSEASAWTYPAAPENLTAAPGDKLVSLTWDDPSNSSITRYEYQQTTSGSCSGAWTSMTDSNADTTQFVKSGLTNGTDYTFCVRAYSAGAGATSAKATAQPQPLPAMPASADATATDASSATVTWSYATLSLIEKFQVRYRAGAEAWGSWTDVAKTTSPLTYTVSSGLDYGTVYTFEVRAVNNQSKAGPAAQARAATAPAKPTGLSAAPGFRQVTLTWDDPDYTSITHWQYSKDNGTTWTSVPGSGATTTSYTVTDLVSNRAYAFKVRAVNAAGNGAASDAVSSTPPAKPTEPSTITLTETFQQGTPSYFTLTVGWKQPDDDTIDGYQYRQARPVGGLTAFGGNGVAELSWSTPSDTTGIAKWQYRSKARSASAFPNTWTDVPNSVADTVSVTVGSLTNATAYDFQVRAATSANALVGAVLGDAEATPSTAAGWTDVPGSTGSTTSFQLPGEFRGIASWAVQVRAENEAGYGTVSNTASVYMLPDKPTLSVDKTFGANGYTVGLAWDKLQRHNEDDSSILSWHYRGVQTDLGASASAAAELNDASWHAVPNSDKDTKGHSLSDVAAFRYTLQVRAVNPAGTGAPSDAESIILAPAPPAVSVTVTPPAADVHSGPANGGTATLFWPKPDDPSIKRYQYRENDASRWRNIYCPSNDCDRAMAHMVYLRLGRTYDFEVRAVNVAGPGLAARPSRPLGGYDWSSTAPTTDGKLHVGSLSSGVRRVTLTASAADYAAMKAHLKANAAVHIGGWRVTVSGDPTFTDGASGKRKVVFNAVHVGGTVPSSGTDIAVSLPDFSIVTAPAVSRAFTAVPGAARGQASLQWNKPDAAATITGWEYRRQQLEPIAAGSYGWSDDAPTDDGKLHVAPQVAAGPYAWSDDAPTTVTGKLHVGDESGGVRTVTMTVSAADYTGLKGLKANLKDGSRVKIGGWIAAVEGAPTFTDAANNNPAVVAFDAADVRGAPPDSDSGDDIGVALLNVVTPAGSYGWSSTAPTTEDGKINTGSLNCNVCTVTLTALAADYPTLTGGLRVGSRVKIGGWTVDVDGGLAFKDGTGGAGLVKFNAVHVAGSRPTSDDDIGVALLEPATRYKVTLTAVAPGFAEMKLHLENGALLDIQGWRLRVVGDPTLTPDGTDSTKGTVTFTAETVSGVPPSAGNALPVRILQGWAWGEWTAMTDGNIHKSGAVYKYTVGGLVPAGEYFFQARGVNDTGTGRHSGVAAHTARGVRISSQAALSLSVAEESSVGRYRWSPTALDENDDTGKLHVGSLTGGAYPVTLTASAADYAALKAKLKDGWRVRIGGWVADVDGAPVFTDGTGGAGLAAFDAVHVAGSRPSSGSAIGVTISPPLAYTVALTVKPASSVTVTPKSSNSEVKVTPSSVRFTTTNWSTPQTFTRPSP